MNTTYPSDLTDAEWDCVQRYLPSRSPHGKPAPTQTHQLFPVPGNPAIGAIPLAHCQVIDPSTNQPIMDPITHQSITTDQRGAPRWSTAMGDCDIGAHEYSNIPSPVISGKDRYARFLQVPLRSEYMAFTCFAERHAKKIELFLTRSTKLTEKRSDDLVLPAASCTWVDLIAVR